MPTPTPLRVLFLVSEADPFIKIGGLGDVGGSLPPVIHQLGEGVDIRLVIPFHSAIPADKFAFRPIANFTVAHESGAIPAQAYETQWNGLTIYLIGGGPFAASVPVYSNDWGFDGHKYVFFSLAALELARALNWAPHIVHANDWHTAAAVAALAQRRASDPFFAATRTILSIHNLPYLGVGAEIPLRAFGIQPAAGSALPEWAHSLPLPLGLLHADRIVAVSPGYADEILTPEFGSGLHGFLKLRQPVISGILNGLDLSRWEPSSDSAIAAPFNANTLTARSANKSALQTELGLALEPTTPLLAMITRMDYQKGVDLTLDALRQLAAENWQAVILGTGMTELEISAQRLEETYPGRVRAAIRFDTALSRRIYAGADMLLMPSRYEPCGLAQMIAMRYGCIPVARATGGLRDTIRDVRVADEGFGFLFADATAEGMTAALRAALQAYARPDEWQAMQRSAMAQNFSWTQSAQQYIALYRSLAAVSV